MSKKTLIYLIYVFLIIFAVFLGDYYINGSSVVVAINSAIIFGAVYVIILVIIEFSSMILRKWHRYYGDALQHVLLGRKCESYKAHLLEEKHTWFTIAITSFGFGIATLVANSFLPQFVLLTLTFIFWIFTIVCYSYMRRASKTLEYFDEPPDNKRYREIEHLKDEIDTVYQLMLKSLAGLMVPLNKYVEPQQIDPAKDLDFSKAKTSAVLDINLLSGKTKLEKNQLLGCIFFNLRSRQELLKYFWLFKDNDHWYCLETK